MNDNQNTNPNNMDENNKGEQVPAAGQAPEEKQPPKEATPKDAEIKNSAPSEPPKEEKADAKAEAAAAADRAQQEKQAAKQKKKEEKLKKQDEKDAKLEAKIARRRPRRKHYIYRTIGGLLRFTLTLLLGMAIAYGSIIGAVYYAVSGLTIDELQKFGIATDADRYLTQNGEVDLTSMSLLELIADLNAVRADLGNHTLQTLIDHYGVVFPEETLAALPTDLFSIPLTTLLSSEGGEAITQNLKFGYILSFLPEAMLSPRVIEVLSERPLALLTNAQYGELFSGVKLGDFLGVTFDEEANVVPVNPEQLTMQEALAELDLGHVLGATTQNGDLLGVVATDLGDKELRPIMAGFMKGALLEKICEGRSIKDVLLADPNTGRYTFSLPALCTGVYLGDALGYVLVGDTWYSTYTDNGDDSDDVPVSSMNAALAKIALVDVVNKTLSLDQTFDGMYFGDLQNGYSRGDAITEPNPEGGDDLVVGYRWYKDGAEVGKMQSKLANLMVNDVLNGKLDITATLGSLHIGDLQGYTYREIVEGDTVVGHKWVKVASDNTETEVSPVLSAIADIALSDVLNGQLDIVAALGSLKIGEVQSYTLGEDLLWYRTVTEGEETKLVYVGAVQNALANVALSDVMRGQLNLTSTLGSLHFGDLQGYTYREILEGDTVVGHKWVKVGDDNTETEISPVLSAIADISLSTVLEGKLDIAASLGSLHFGDLQGYTYREILEGDTVVGHKWVKVGNDGTETEISPVLSAIADISVSTVLDSKLDIAEALGSLTLGEVQGYTRGEDLRWYRTVTEGDETKLVYVGAVQNALSNVALSEVMNGRFSLASALSSLRMGDAMGYVRGEVFEAKDPLNDKSYDKYKFTKSDAQATEVTGTMLEIANLPLSDVLEGRADFSDTVKDMKLGEVLEYTEHNGVWYSKFVAEDSAENVPVKGVLKVLADYKVKELNESTINAIAVGDILGYTKKDTNADGTADTWYDEADEQVAGMLATLSDLTVGELSSGDTLVTKIRDLALADAMGYKLVDGVWYSKYSDDGDPTNDERLTGILAVLATHKLKEIDSATVDAILLGDALGYEKKDTDNNGTPDTWYLDGKPATGVMKTLADLKIGELKGSALSAKIKELTLAEAMEYTLVNGVWYSKYSDDGNATNDVPVTGILAVLATYKLKDINTATIDAIKLGDAIGYEKKDTDSDGILDTWFNGAGEAVTGMLATVVDLTIGKISDGETLVDKMRDLSLADAMGYTLVNGVWYSKYSDDGNAENDVRLTGILAVLATNKLKDINTATIDALKLGDAIGYEKKDTDSDGTPDTWYLGDKPAEGIMASMADLGIGDLKNASTVSEKLGEVELSAVLNYKYENGKWIKNGHVASGVMAHLMGLKISEVEHEIDEMPLGYAFGFYRDENTKAWYTDEAHTKKPTGITASLADIHLTHAREELDDMKIGTLLGYSLVEGVWKDANGKELEGLNLVFADLPISDLGDADKIANAMQSAKLGDSMGYKYVEKNGTGAWYKTKLDGNGNTVADESAPVTGLFSALAGTKIGEVETKLKEVPIGTMLDFTKKADGWYDASDKKVTGVLGVLADANLQNVATQMENMTIGQLYPNPDGILKALDPTTKITDLDKAINNCTIKSLMDAELLTISEQKQQFFASQLGADWASKPVLDFLNYLINGTIPS